MHSKTNLLYRINSNFLENMGVAPVNTLTAVVLIRMTSVEYSQPRL
jgi:hypothetical protein